MHHLVLRSSSRVVQALAACQAASQAQHMVPVPVGTAAMAVVVVVVVVVVEGTDGASKSVGPSA